MDAMSVMVEVVDGMATDDTRKALSDLLTQKIKDIVGVSSTVSVETPSTIERCQGKARRVIDHRPKE